MTVDDRPGRAVDALPNAMPPWFAGAELVVLRAITAVSMGLIAVALVVSLVDPDRGATSKTLALTGLGAMIATPFVRLVLLIAAFVSVRDRRFAVLALAVLAVIAASFAVG